MTHPLYSGDERKRERNEPDQNIYGIRERREREATDFSVPFKGETNEQKRRRSQETSLPPHSGAGGKKESESSSALPTCTHPGGPDFILIPNAEGGGERSASGEQGSLNSFQIPPLVSSKSGLVMLFRNLNPPPPLFFEAGGKLNDFKSRDSACECRLALKSTASLIRKFRFRESPTRPCRDFFPM